VKELAERMRERLTGRGMLMFVLTAAVLAAIALWIVPLVSRMDPFLFLSAVLAGLAVGWVVGRLPLPPWAAGAAVSALGMDYLLFTISRSDIPLWSWIGNTAAGFLNLLPQFRDPFFDTGLWWTDTQRLLLGPVTVVVRFGDWVQITAKGGEFTDPAAVALLWSVLLCLAGSFAGWVVSARGRPLAGILPAVLLMGGVFVSAGGDWHSVVAASGLALVLTAAVEHTQKEQEWERRRIGYAAALRWDMVFSTTPVIIALVAGAYILPAISLDDIARWIREHTQPTAAAVAGPGNAGGSGAGSGDSSNPPAVKEFSHSLALGAGPDLSQNVALVVVTGENLTYLPETREPVAPQHYWKGMTYDLYSGTGWLTSQTEERELEPEAVLFGVVPPEGMLHQEVTVSRAGIGPVFATGEWVKISLPSRLVLRTHEDLFGIIVDEPVYEVDSIVRHSDEAALRAAGIDYPDWIHDRYLQLPLSLPRRVHSLARDLTAAQLTPYDQALAIESYLRREMRYSLEVEKPPFDQDAVDYFLFDSKTGFCQYYASAMVVLARSAGVPARLAVGFGPGTFDTVRGRFTVLESDSHAWPELYFPGIGWVEFEPTVSMPLIHRTAPAASAPARQAPQTAGRGLGAMAEAALSALRRFGAPALLALAALPVLFAVWTLTSPLRFLLISPPRAIRAMYRELVAHGRRQGIRFSPATTPAEFAARFSGRFPAEEPSLRKVAEGYARLVYGGKTPTRRQRREAVGAWRRLNPRMWWAWWNNRWKTLGRRKMAGG
jgi:hypothetical protein